MNYADFCKKHGIKLTAKGADSNPNFPDDNGTMSHWRCTLRHGGRRMTLVFSMGLAYGGEPPKVGDVLSCLMMDTSVADQAFEEWASDLGYDTDSRKAERTYRAVARQTAKLHNLLGDTYEEAQRLEDE